MGGVFGGFLFWELRFLISFYADDVMLVSSWDPENANCLYSYS